MIPFYNNNPIINGSLSRAYGFNRALTFFTFGAGSDHPLQGGGFIKDSQLAMALGDHATGRSWIALTDDIGHEFVS